MLGNKYFKYDKDKKYVLFLEAREETYSPAAVSSFLSHIEQNDFIRSVTGLVFGHYSKNVPADLYKRFERFGQKYDIPVIYCDDFGHGVNHAMLPIGERAMLDADKQTLRFM
jgi:muramoyltetrapeptide carboxypeptidase